MIVDGFVAAFSQTSSARRAFFRLRRRDYYAISVSSLGESEHRINGGSNLIGTSGWSEGVVKTRRRGEEGGKALPNIYEEATLHPRGR